MSDITPTPSVVLSDVGGEEKTLLDVGVGSDVDLLEYDGDGIWNATEEVSFTESLYYQTERAFGDGSTLREALSKSAAVGEVGGLSFVEALQIGLSRSDTTSLSAVAELVSGIGEGGMGQLGIGGYKNVAG